MEKKNLLNFPKTFQYTLFHGHRKNNQPAAARGAPQSPREADLARGTIPMGCHHAPTSATEMGTLRPRGQ